jgi:ABC-type dipeptide/oligopeptide/nickel transport system ATPase component
MNPPGGCRFHTRCRLAQECCGNDQPALRALPNETRVVACHFAEQALERLGDIA